MKTTFGAGVKDVLEMAQMMLLWILVGIWNLSISGNRGTRGGGEWPAMAR